jgi:putative transposase
MIQVQLKLRPNRKQEAVLTGWLWNLTGVWNWAVRKIALDAKDKIYYSAKDFQNLLANHGEKMEIPSHTLQGILSQAHIAWTRCFKKIAKQPRLKGMRNKLNSIPFPDPIKPPKDTHIGIPGLGKLRFHKQDLPEGKIKCGRIVKRASGWYLCLFIATDREPIERVADGQLGIDPGFKSEPDARFSTMTCSDCGSRSGPTGWDGLAVRQWRCSDCGSLHDRDVNAARNTLLAGLGTSHEVHCAKA